MRRFATASAAESVRAETRVRGGGGNSDEACRALASDLVGDVGRHSGVHKELLHLVGAGNGGGGRFPVEPALAIDVHCHQARPRERIHLKSTEVVGERLEQCAKTALDLVLSGSPRRRRRAC